jgi:hypothetical protein
MKQKCSICNKKFTRLTALRRHRGICELLNQSNRCQKADLEEIADLPPINELWSIVKTLVQENIKLKKDMEKIKNWVHTKKKKINIINWLNENKKPVLTFQEWKLKINIYDSDLNLIFDNGFITGIAYILERNLKLTEELPIRAFQQKSNCLYIYEDKGNLLEKVTTKGELLEKVPTKGELLEKVPTKGELLEKVPTKGRFAPGVGGVSPPGWRILETDEFKELISYVNKNLLIYFKKWYNKNIKLINDSSSNDDTYQKNIIKIMGGKVPYDQRIKKINSKLFKYLNIDIKNIIQYEFNF